MGLMLAAASYSGGQTQMFAAAGYSGAQTQATWTTHLEVSRSLVCEQIGLVTGPLSADVPTKQLVDQQSNLGRSGEAQWWKVHSLIDTGTETKRINSNNAHTTGNHCHRHR